MVLQNRMARAPKRAQKIRRGGEFSGSAKGEKRPPAGSGLLEGWTVEQIYAARSAQMRGQFRLAADMADAMRTDDALFTAYGNRLAPQRSIAVTVRPAVAKGKATSISEEAASLYGDSGIALTMATRLNVHGCLVNHGVAFLRLTRQVRDDGSRVDLYANFWPIRHVRWDEYRRGYFTRVEAADGSFAGGEVEIVHGDGEWIVVAVCEHEPWKHGAIVAAAVIWARHAFASTDWSAGSATHGNAKPVGTLPEGMALEESAGVLTREAAGFLELLQALASAQAPTGIKPFGSTIDYLVNSSQAWQVWKELVLVAEKAAARIYLGTDGTLGAAGGAPGVDISALFGVAATIVQGDLETIEAALATGLLDVWTAINFGDSSLAPELRYQIPRPEEEGEVEALGKRETLFHAAIKLARDNGFVVDQPWVDDVAARYRVTAPKLPEQMTKAPAFTLAPTDVIRWLTPNEVRATGGATALANPDGTAHPDGAIPIGVLDARGEAAKVAAEAAAQGAAGNAVGGSSVA